MLKTNNLFFIVKYRRYYVSKKISLRRRFKLASSYQPRPHPLFAPYGCCVASSSAAAAAGAGAAALGQLQGCEKRKRRVDAAVKEEKVPWQGQEGAGGRRKVRRQQKLIRWISFGFCVFNHTPISFIKSSHQHFIFRILFPTLSVGCRFVCVLVFVVFGLVLPTALLLFGSWFGFLFFAHFYLIVCVCV